MFICFRYEWMLIFSRMLDSDIWYLVFRFFLDVMCMMRTVMCVCESCMIH